MMMNIVCHYAVISVGRSCCCALSGGIFGNKENRQWCNAMVMGKRPAIIHIRDGGVSLDALGEANEAETMAATGVAVRQSTLVS
jgi:hypothetical protein